MRMRFASQRYSKILQASLGVYLRLEAGEHFAEQVEGACHDDGRIFVCERAVVCSGEKFLDGRAVDRAAKIFWRQGFKLLV